jgi:hypothetical protein
MEQSKSQALRARRRKLQERPANEKRLFYCISHIQPLQEAGTCFNSLDKYGYQNNSPLVLFPACIPTINWSAVLGTKQLDCYLDEHRAATFLKALALSAVANSASRQVFYWVCSAYEQVQMDLAEVRRHVHVLLSMDMDMDMDTGAGDPVISG